MTKLNGLRKFNSGDRLFSLIEYLCIYLDMEVIAVSAVKGLAIPPQPGDWFASLECRQFPIRIQHAVHKPLWASFQATVIKSYELNFVPAATPKENIVHFSSEKWGAVAEIFWNMVLVFF